MFRCLEIWPNVSFTSVSVPENSHCKQCCICVYVCVAADYAGCMCVRGKLLWLPLVWEAATADNIFIAGVLCEQNARVCPSVQPPLLCFVAEGLLESTL